MTPFRIKPGLIAGPISENIFFYERPLLETLEFFDISRGSH